MNVGVLAALLLAEVHATEASPTSSQPPRGSEPVDWVDPFIGALVFLHPSAAYSIAKTKTP